MADEKLQIEKCHCNACSGETNHFLLTSRVKSGSQPLDEDAEYHIEWEHKWDLLECCGCEAVILRHKHWFSEWDGTLTEYFPPAISRELPPWLNQLPEDLQALIKETYAALNASSRRLAVMGARTMVDMVMLEKVGDTGGFKQKLNDLVKLGVLSQQNREYLSAALEAGNAAAHRGHAARPDEVDHVMDIVENLLQTVYVLPRASSALRAMIPPRPPRPARATPSGGQINTPPAEGSS